MFVPFDQLPPTARVWIYQADKKFTDEQKRILSGNLRAFTEGWQVHGEPIDASFDLRFDRFVVLAANDPTSGCSIDHSVRTLKEIGHTTGLDFFDRSLVAFQKGDDVTVVPLAALKHAYETSAWDAGTLTFNNLVDTKGALENSWRVPAGSSWLKRYLPSQAVES